MGFKRNQCRTRQELHQSDAEYIQEFREFLHEYHAKRHDPTRSLRTRQRLAAGYSLAHAARLLGITPNDLKLLEDGQADPLPTLEQEITQLYRNHNP